MSNEEHTTDDNVPASIALEQLPANPDASTTALIDVTETAQDSKARTEEETNDLAFRFATIGGQVLIGLKEFDTYAHQAADSASGPLPPATVRMIAKIADVCLQVGPLLENLAQIEEQRQLPDNRQPGP